MTRFRIRCPECGATLFTANRLSALLEFCPTCRKHVWDLYDALMADVVSLESGRVVGANTPA